MNAALLPTPDALVENGRLHTGFFTTPFRRVNLLEAPLFGGVAALPLRWLRLKEWVGFGINHPRLFGGILVQDAKLACSATVYLYDKETRVMNEWLVLDLPGRVHLPETLWDSSTHCGFPGWFVHFQHCLERGFHTISARCPATRTAPALSVEMTLFQDMTTYEPLVVSLPMVPRHHTYTHKSPVRLKGSIRIGQQTYFFEPARDVGNLDEQKSFYPYSTRWWWGCALGNSDAGSEVVVNFVNQLTPKHQQGEDAVWVDGRLSLLPRPRIEPLERPGDVHIHDDSDRLNLRFVQEGAKKEKRWYGPISMDYQQAFGRFSGHVVDSAGARHQLDSSYGALEHMDARF